MHKLFLHSRFVCDIPLLCLHGDNEDAHQGMSRLPASSLTGVALRLVELLWPSTSPEPGFAPALLVVQ